MNEIHSDSILLLNKHKEIVSIYLSEKKLIWHIQGEVKGQLKLNDIVFCQYLNKTDEIVIIALPRKKERGKIEIRERTFYQVHFYNNPLLIYKQNIHLNNAYNLYKRLFAILLDDYEKNTDELVSLNKRFYNDDEKISQLRTRLLVNPNHSILDLYSHRNIFVILNPHGGNTQAHSIWEDIVKPLFYQMHIKYTFQTTNYPGHAEDLGVQFDFSTYDSVLFISGDGTVNEFLNGVLSRGDARSVLFFTTIGMIPAGSQNSLARGMGTLSVYTALYCILKRRVRFFDGMCVENGAHLCRYAFAGCGWGIISDMVKDYENYRCLKQYRYWLLKGIHGCFCRRNHYCSFRYIEDDNQIRLQCNHALPSCEECIEHSYHSLSLLPELPQSDLGISLSLTDSSSTDLESNPIPAPSNESSPLHSHCSQLTSITNDLINSFELGKCRWYEEEGFFHTIGIINTSPDSKWCHISFSVFETRNSFTLKATSGVLDVVVARKGTWVDDAIMALRYVIGKEYEAESMLYRKVRVLEINSSTDDVVMLDGEVFPGPNPFRFISIPSLLTVFGEYSCV